MNNQKLREAADLATTGIEQQLRAIIWGDALRRRVSDVIYLAFTAYAHATAPAPVDDKALAEAIEDIKAAANDYGESKVFRDHTYLVINALRAAQQEVKKLRQDNDDHAESWALCGIPHESQLTKILVQQDEIQKLKREVAELREWKRQQLEVEATWSVQAVGKLLDVPLGKSIRPEIAPGIEALQSDVKALRKDKERLDWLEETKEMLTAWDSPGDNSTSNGWTVGSFVEGKEASGKTAREAIDKARAAGERNGATHQTIDSQDESQTDPIPHKSDGSAYDWDA